MTDNLWLLKDNLKKGMSMKLIKEITANCFGCGETKTTEFTKELLIVGRNINNLQFYKFFLQS